MDQLAESRLDTWRATAVISTWRHGPCLLPNSRDVGCLCSRYLC